ncbi:hypothetical protein [Nocardia noduli]|uniref:hypothetical protein n=1 Tax=Nocardia noduli TaxID=2815722 RepID=UPI001C21A222|nr:hypothetical protein [Nocardia noduli]
MRISFPRTAAVCSGLALVAAVALTGCSSDDESTSSTSTSASAGSAASSAAAAPGAADAETTKAITDAYTVFFNAAAPVDQRIASVEKGDIFAPVLQAQAADPAKGGTTATVSAVKTVDATNAKVTYTLLMGGNPVLPNQGGEAVKIDGKWKVGASTFCALMALQGGTSAAC